MRRNLVRVVVALAFLTGAGAAARSPQAPIARPTITYATREDAARGGCRAAAVKGPTIEACITTSFHGNQVDLVVYERPVAGRYAASEVMALTSWYWGAKLSLVDALGTGTQWMVVDTEGMRGTGISQRVMVIIAWDGSRFRTVAAETLGYRCSRPASAADYRLDVRQAFQSKEGTLRMQLDYDLLRDEQRIGAWTGGLVWNAEGMAFVAVPDAVTLAHPLVDAIRSRITAVREHSMTRPLDPAANSDTWIGQSGLTSVMAPACAL